MGSSAVLGTARTGMFYIGLFALKMKHLVEVWEVLCLVVLCVYTSDDVCLLPQCLNLISSALRTPRLVREVLQDTADGPRNLRSKRIMALWRYQPEV
ncbi:hypothetical protein RHGRI_013967 [Rhododendron griersonianum]|uniref:Uncharacterized protein n=1 Tax=Rhododendron griersonianum TaxID=479676 RepID=A0AAV6K7N0_9ERIC|nr:hypothetical protein RHGRI_013967 [Rhododendron griersonianum]